MSATQTEIPGTEAPKIKDVEKAASAYVDARDAWQSASDKVQEKKTKLIDACKAHVSEMSVDGDGNRIYKYGDLLVILTHKDGVKVKAAEDPE